MSSFIRDEAHALAAIWLLPVAARRNQGSLWLTWSLLTTGLLLATSIAYFGGPKYASAGFGGPLILLVLLWWPLFVDSVFRSCTPTNLQLVPGLVRHHLLATAILWVALTLTVAACFALPFGHFARTWLSSAVVLCIIVWARRSYAFAIVIGIAFMALLYGKEPNLHGLTEFLRDLDNNSLSLELLVILMLAFAAFTLRWMIGRPNARRNLRYQAIATIRENWERASRGESPLHLPSSTHIFAAYSKSLAAAIRRNGNPARLVAFGLGPSIHWHWVGFVFAGLTYSLLLLCLLLLPVHFNGDSGGRFSAMFVALLPLATLVPVLEQAIYRSRREQALLCLTQRCPSGTELNRTLAHVITRYLLSGWLTTLGLAVFWLIALNISLRELALAVTAISVSMLTVFAFAFRNYAHMRKPGSFPSMFKVISPALAFVAIWIAEMRGGLYFAIALSLCIAIPCAGIATWRWRHLVNGPQALPAGRLLKA
ncbi:MAG: hypothetical protein ABI583_10625 [Betaproteobacteria bacterium]